MLAIRRLKSDDRVEVNIGLKNIYYNVMALLGVFIYCSISIKTDLGFLLNVFLIVFSVSFLFAAFITKDYGNIKNVHKGTLEKYIHEINMPNNTNIKKAVTFKQILLKVFEQFYFLLAFANILFFYGVLFSGELKELMLSITNEKIDFLELLIIVILFTAWTIFNFKISMGLMYDKIKSMKASQDLIKKYMEIKELDNEEKSVFMQYMKNLIKEKGFVSKNDLYEWCLRTQRILEERKKYEGIKEGINCPNANQHEYQDILDYEDLKPTKKDDKIAVK